MLSDRGELAVVRAADPLHGRAGFAPFAACPVGEALGGDGGAGQPVPVDGGPEPVGVLAAAVLSLPPVEHSGPGVPAARVLAVAALVGADPLRGHGQVGDPAGAAVHGPVHRGEQGVADGFGCGGDGGVGRRLEPGQVGDAELRRGEDRADGVPFDPALHHAVPPVAFGGGGAAREQRDGGDQPLAVEVVAAHDAELVALEEAPADGTAVDAVHHQTVVDERGVGVLDAVEDDLAGPGR